MASFNKVVLMGRCTRDVELRHIPSGSAVTDLGVALNRRKKDGDDEVTFVDVTLWGKDAEIAAEYLGKGKPVLIEGRLQLDEWDDKKGGGARSKLKVVCQRLVLLDRSVSDAAGDEWVTQVGTTPEPERQESPAEVSQEAPPDDEVPF
jgi:single-strand DNA-binding protein